MIRLMDVTSPHRKRSFIDFIYRVYRGQACFKDTLVPVVKLFLDEGDAFTAAAFIRAIQVASNGDVVAQCMLVHHPAMPVLQVAFFEALPEQDAAVDRLIGEARAEARRRGLTCIVAGLNGHLAYDVGFLIPSTTCRRRSANGRRQCFVNGRHARKPSG